MPPTSMENLVAAKMLNSVSKSINDSKKIRCFHLQKKNGYLGGAKCFFKMQYATNRADDTGYPKCDCVPMLETTGITRSTTSIGCPVLLFQRSASQNCAPSGMYLSPFEFPYLVPVWVPDRYIRPPRMPAYVTSPCTDRRGIATVAV